MTQRIIKFRAWDRKNTKWIYFELLGGGFVPHSAWNPDDIEPWQEFTGLLDKNSKEIYEGDIIQAVYPNILEPLMRKRGERYEIVFRVGAFKAFDLATKDSAIEDSFLHDKSFGRTHLEGYEIIGNIYSNPELLHESK